MYAAIGVFIAWVMLVYEAENAQPTQTVNSETLWPALTLTTDSSWDSRQASGAVHLSRGESSCLSLLNVRGIYDTTNRNGGKTASDAGRKSRAYAITSIYALSPRRR